MAYTRFIPGFSRHPKRIKCGPVSSWLWACSVDHCTEHLTDGFLEDCYVPALVPGLGGSALKKCIANLLAVGSWERVDHGYQVHDYLKYNLSKTQVQADQQAGRKRYDKWLEQRRSDGVSNGPPNAVGNAVYNAAHGYHGYHGVKEATAEGPVAHATGSNGHERDHDTKKREALALLNRAYPGLTQPSGMTNA